MAFDYTSFDKIPRVVVVPSSQPRDIEEVRSIDTKVGRVYSSRSKIPGIIQGLANSPTIRTLAITVLAGGLAIGALFLLVHFQVLGPPPRWMIAAVAGGGVAFGALLGVGVQLPFKGKQKLEFEYSGLARLIKGNNYHEIVQLPNGRKIYLGALPNRLANDAEKLVWNGVTGFVSLNEPWEVNQAYGLVQPYRDSDYEEMGVDSRRLFVKDHTLLDDDDLNTVADYMDEILQKGDVYVHCRAGVGRSAMGVAAYLIKYEGYTVEQACTRIKTQRDESTIWNKVGRLMEYEAEMIAQEVIKDNLDERLNELAKYVRDMDADKRSYAPPLAYAAYRIRYDRISPSDAELFFPVTGRY